MRPFRFSSAFFPIFSAAAFVAAARAKVINNTDNQISYSSEWKFMQYVDGRTLSYNDKGSGTASLRVYNASRIAVNVLVQSFGQTVQISLDNQTHDVIPSLTLQPAWISGSLDSGVPHDLQVIKQNPDGQFTALDFINVTHNDPSEAVQIQAEHPSTSARLASQTETTHEPPSSDSLSPGSSVVGGASTINETGASASGSTRRPDSSTNGSTRSFNSSTASSLTSHSPPQQSSTSSAQQSNTEPALSGGKLAATIAVSIAIPTIIIIGISLYRRRKLGKRKAASTAYLESIAARGRVRPGLPFRATSLDEKFGRAEGFTRPGSAIGDSAHPPALGVAL